MTYELLIPLKVYEVEYVDDLVCLTDEAGESAVYPAEFFVAASFEMAAASRLREKMKIAA